MNFQRAYNPYYQPQMDAMAQVAHEYVLFNQVMNGNLNLPGIFQPAMVVPQQPIMGPRGVVVPAGYLAPAPEDPPLRPGIILDTEHWLNRGEGFFMATAILFAWIVGGTVRLVLITTLLLFGFYKYTIGRAEVAQFQQMENFRASGRLAPAPLPQQRYVVEQNFF
jgi:hypothetical protein